MTEPRFKAKETLYAGITFRSRLESRWACFFDAAGIEWEYEPERISLPGGGSYLADFRTNGSGWVEVKGAEENLDKPYLIRAAMELGHLTILGPIPDCRRGIPGRAVLLARAGQDPTLSVSWCDYRPQRASKDPFVAFGPKRAGKVLPLQPWDGAQGWLSPPYSPGGCRGTCPYDAARGARFEHGQSGRV